MPPLAIDHAVVAVRDLERAAHAFTELGFTLTPLGVHSIGSRNHCIVLGATYVELLEPSGTHPWLDHYRGFLEKRGDGLAALALRTPDAEASYRDLLAQGVAVEPPMDLARPVTLDGEERVARFRIVQVAPEVFVCQHCTPELVWRPEWQKHRNGAAELASIDFPGASPFVGAPAGIRWRSSAALHVSGLSRRAAVQLHGVALVAA